MSAPHCCLPSAFTLMACGTNSVGGCSAQKPLQQLCHYIGNLRNLKGMSQRCANQQKKERNKETKTKHKPPKNSDLYTQGFCIVQNKTPDWVTFSLLIATWTVFKSLMRLLPLPMAFSFFFSLHHMTKHHFDNKDQEKLGSCVEDAHSWKTAATAEFVSESSVNLN